MTRYITRFAPSPTGHLHLGHIVALKYAYDAAKNHHGKMLLRMEDIDHTRCHAHFSQQIIDDMAFLGLSYDGDVLYQSRRFDAYQHALDILKQQDLLYPCFCTRKILQQSHNPYHAPHDDDAISPYPQYCRDLPEHTIIEKMKTTIFSWRLKMDNAIAIAHKKYPKFYHFYDREAGWQYTSPDIWGDIVIARKDIPTSYHLAVVVDDAYQQISLVTRGNDLLHQTPIHLLLQILLDYPKPDYAHHQLLCDDTGKRLAKRHDSLSVKTLREQGLSADDIIAKSTCL